MFRHFARLEILESFTGAKFVIVFVLSSILIISSVFAGYLKYSESVRWQSVATAANKTALADQGNWRKMQLLGSKATRTPSRLSILIRGVDGSVGKSAYATPSAQLILRDSRDELNPVYALLSELDLGFIIRVVLSLFALLFSFNAVSGDRENGTLKMILSNSMSRSSILWGKLLGNLLVLALSLVIPVLFSLVLVELLAGFSFSMEEWIRVWMILLAGLAYLILFYVIGLLVSTLTRRSIVSFTICLLVWVSVVAVLPRIAIDLSSSTGKVKTLEEIEREIALIRQERWKKQVRLLEEYVNPELERQLNQKYDRAKISAQQDKAKHEAFSEFQQKEEALVNDYYRELQNQTKAGLNYALISPASLFDITTMKLAATDAEVRFRFLQHLNDFRKVFQEYAQDKIDSADRFQPGRVSWNLNISNSEETGEGTYELETFGPTEQLEINDAPQFTMPKQPLENLLSEALPLIALIIVQSLVIFLSAVFIFNGYDPR